MDERVAVVGAGAWGTTMAARLAPRRETTLWVREADVATDVATRNRNERFLPGFDLPPQLQATTSLADAVGGAAVVIVGVPSPYLRTVAEELAHVIPRDAVVVSLVKGIEAATRLRPTQVLAEVLPIDPDRIGVLSGPNLAREVMAGHPSATVVAIHDQEWAERLQAIVGDDRLRVYTARDVVGCEIGGAGKNVLAIAAGMADGMGFGWNTRAALTTRGLAELARLGVALGGEPLTFLGLAGNGDLIATCGSPDSRNHAVGEALARGASVQEIVAGTTSVAEGIRTAPAVLQLAEEMRIEMPICSQVAAVLAGDRTPAEALDLLMRREPRRELDGLGG